MAITAEVVINFHAGSAAVSSVTANNSTSNASGTIFSDLVDVNNAATGCSFSSPHTRVCDTGGRAGTGSTLDQEINTNIAYFDVSGAAVHTYTLQLTASHPAVDVYVYSATSYSGQQALSIDVNGTTVTDHDASNQLGGNASAAPVYFPSVTPNGSDQIVITIDNTNQFAAFNGLRIVPTGPAATADQEGFRFGLDDGSESAHTWAAAQDTNHSVTVGTAVLIRNLVNGTGDLASTAYTLRYQKNGTGGYVAVPVGPTVAEVLAQPTWGAVGTAASGTNTANPSYPTGISAATSKIIAVCTGRSDTADSAFTAPAGWTSLGQLEGGTGTFGVDTGTRRVGFFVKDTTTGSESGTTGAFGYTAGGATNSTLRVSVHRIEVPSGYTLDTAFASGADTTNGTGYSATASGNLTLDANRLLLLATAQNIDTGTATSRAISATGITFGTLTNRADTAVTNGQDHRHIVNSVPVSSGSGTVAPTYSYTISASGSGPTGFLSLRARLPAVTNEVYIATSANIAASGEATTARLTAPSGKTTGDFVTGRRWDDENGTDTIDITTDDYTEVEWSINTQSPAVATDYFEFRVYAGASAFSTYTVTPRLTLTSGGTPTTINGAIGSAAASGLAATISAATVIGGGVGSATASGLAASITVSTTFSDDFEAGGGNGSLDGWTIFQPGNGPAPTRAGGRYDSGSITAVGSTTWFNADRGVAVWKLLNFPTSGQPDKEVIFYNVGVGPTANPTAELTFVDASHYALAGAVVHDSNTANINYEFLVIGHRGADGQYTLETKTTTSGASQVSDVGDNAVGSGVTHADIRVLLRNDNTLRWYYRPPGGTTWTAINTTGTPGIAHGGGFTFSSGSAYVGFVCYAFSAVPTAFRGVADRIELVGEVSTTTTISGGVGSATASGLSATVALTTTIAGGVGAAAASGVQAAIDPRTTISGGIGSASASGLQASVTTSTQIAAGVGTAAASGLAASIPIGTVIQAGISSSTASGLQAGVSVSTVVSGSVGEAAASGLAALIATSTGISAGVAVADASGLAATVRPSLLVSGQVGVAQASGPAAAVVLTTTIATGVGAAAATGRAATINIGNGVSIGGAVGEATASGVQANIITGTVIAAGVAAAEALGLGAQIVLSTPIAVGVGTATASGLAATIGTSSATTINGDVGVATAAGLPVSLATSTTIICGVASASAQGLPASITAQLGAEINAGVAVAAASGLQATLTLVELVDPSVQWRYDVPAGSLRYDIPAGSWRFDVPSIGSDITI